LDADHHLVTEMQTSLFERSEVKTMITRGSFNDFALAMRIELQFDIAFNGSYEIKDIGHLMLEQNDQAKVKIIYANDRVDSALSDKIFKETESSMLKWDIQDKTEWNLKEDFLFTF
jgi:hypothetical protein